jgi:hypothetical protein
VTSTIEPTTTPAATTTIDPATPTAYVITVTPVPTAKATPAVGPPSAPIYTVSCTLTGLVLNSTSTVVTGISGNITNISTGDSIFGSVNSDSYQFSHVPAGFYDLVLDVQYTIFYTNNSTSDRNTIITDSFEVNGNVDETYPLY